LTWAARGTIWGALLAALIMVPLMDYMKGLLEPRLIIYGVSMILVMIFYPRGIVGVLESIGSLFGKRSDEFMNIRNSA